MEKQQNYMNLSNLSKTFVDEFFDILDSLKIIYFKANVEDINIYKNHDKRIDGNDCKSIRIMCSELSREDFYYSPYQKLSRETIRNYTCSFINYLIRDKPKHVNKENIRIIFNFDDNFITTKDQHIIIKPFCEIISVDEIENKIIM